MGRADPKAGSLQDGSQHSDHFEPGDSWPCQDRTAARLPARRRLRGGPLEYPEADTYAPKLAEIYSRFVGDHDEIKIPKIERNEL
jgi:hypothetical protein